MFEFFLFFVIALFSGNIQLVEISAISSDNPVAYSETILEWPCGWIDKETCWWNITTGETGP